MAARPFDDPDPEANLTALAAVPYVGASALNALKAYIVEWFPGCPALGGTFEGVVFTDAQANDVLDLANRGSGDDLDAITGIGPTLAGRILDARPLATITELGAVSGIGASVLTALRDEVTARWCGQPIAACGCGAPGADPGTPVTVDGVAFTAVEAATALVIANEALSAQLRADGGLDQSVTQILLGGRPWPDLVAVGAASGIGPATMTLLRDYAASGLWRGPGEVASAVTVAWVVENAVDLEDTWVAFNRVLFTEAMGGDVFEARIVDAPNAAIDVKVRQYLWDPVGHAQDDSPPLAAGEWFQLVHLKVTFSYGELVLRMVETSETTHLGCELGWSRPCGIPTGVCEVGAEVCGAEGWSECSGMIEQMGWDPPDGLDNDCDGAVDENTFSLTEIAWLDEPLTALGVAGANSLAATDSELLRIDLSDPTYPRVAERVTPSTSEAFNVQSIRVFGNTTVLAGCKNGTWIFPHPMMTLDPSVVIPSAADASVAGCNRDAALLPDGTVASANWTFGIYAHDLSAPTPTETFHVAHTYPRALAPFGDRIATVGNGFALYDPAGDGDPDVTASPPTYVRSMALSDAGLLVVTTSAGMAIWDISSAPLVAVYGVWSDGPDAWHADFQDHFLATVPNGSGRTLSVIDLSIPPSPQVVAEAEVPNPSGITSGSALRGVAFAGDVLYAWGGTGLHVYRLGP